jgi:hypothetical protein
MADSRLADIYRKELKTKGLLGALVSASGARLKEKTDIRGILPQTGVSGAAFEKMFGKRYKYGGDKQAIRSSGGSDGAATKSMEEKLTRIGVDSKLTAKNTVVLPAMARDMNLMRMNMQKMVKLSGGTPSTKSDMFFKRAGDREAQYEGQYKKNSGGLAPTPVGEKKEGGGFFDMIKGFLGMGIGPLIESILGGLFKAGLLLTIMNGIGKYFSDKDFRESVNNAFDKFFTAVFGEDYKKQLTIGAGILIAAMVGLEAAFTAAAIRISRLGGGLGLPSSNPSSGPGGKGGRGGWMKTLGRGALAIGGVALLTEGVKYYLQQGESEADAKKLAQQDIDNQARETLSPGEEIVSKKPEGMRGSEIVDRAGSAAQSAITIGTGISMLPSGASPIPSTVAPPSAAGKPLTSFGSVGANREMEKNKTLWEKIAKVMKKAYEKGASKIMLSKLGQKFGTWMAIKMATVAAGVVAAPFSAGASLLISAIGVGMLAKDVYDLYEWFMEYEKELDAFEKSSSPTPVAAEPTNVSPSSAPATSATPMAPAAAPRVTPGGAGKRGGSTSPTPSGGGAGVLTNGPVDPSKTTFADLTVEQQDAFFAEQRKQEGFKPGSLSYDLNNPGNMLFQPWQKKYGGELDTTGRGVGSVKGKFAKFPTLQDGVNAQRALWMSPSYANLPLDKALNKWVTGNPNSDMDVNMKAKNTNYKNGIYAAIGGAPTTTLASASPSTPSTGATLTQAQSTLSTLAMNNSSGGQTIVNAPTNNSVIGGGSGGGTGNMNPYNGDIMKYLLRPVA